MYDIDSSGELRTVYLLCRTLYIAGERQCSLEIVELILTGIPSKGRPYMEHRRYRIGIYLRNRTISIPIIHAAQHWAKDYLLGGKIITAIDKRNP